MNYICEECYYVGKPETDDLPILLLIMVPLLLLFNSGNQTLFCPKCQSKNTMIPIDSDRANEIIKQNNLTIPDSLLNEPKYPWLAS